MNEESVHIIFDGILRMHTDFPISHYSLRDSMRRQDIFYISHSSTPLAVHRLFFRQNYCLIVKQAAVCSIDVMRNFDRRNRFRQ